MHTGRIIRLISSLLSATLLAACAHAPPSAPPPAAADDAFRIDQAVLRQPTRFIVYGDMRFTDVREAQASRPGPRQALVAEIAAERPDALFLTGDVPWHGGDERDYRVYRQETAAWRAERLRVFPVLGNHEFQQCEQLGCLERWWQAFPDLRGRRWYAVTLGAQLQFIALDSNASLLPGSEQAQWLQRRLDAPADGILFVVILLHHPPMTDAPAGVRANEAAMAAQLTAAARHSSRHFIVCAAHVHNYERFERDGVTYLVSGGGGAKPLPVTRSAADRYQGDQFPNFHYLRFELLDHRLRGEMVRLADADAPAPGKWVVQDRFDVGAPPP